MKLAVTAAIARQEWMKPLEEGLQKLVHKAFAGGPRGKSARNFLHGTWIGHPLHVILTDIPIGAWTTAMVFDAAAGLSGREEFDLAADSAIAVGLAGALGAAATGLTDWQDIDPPARRIGLVHGLLNITSAALFAGSLVARRRDSRARGRSLAALGYAISVGAARLGGNLVYGHKIGVDHSNADALPAEFASVLKESELGEGKPVRAEHNGTPIVLVRRGGEVFALAETCSHLGGPLSEGTLDGDVIQCPWHGSRFSLRNGDVVDGPAVHPQPCLETRVRNGQIEVRRSECTQAQAPGKGWKQAPRRAVRPRERTA